MVRRSVKLDIPDWPGWVAFTKMLEQGREEAPYPEDSIKYATILFETGCRVSEAIQLRPSMFKMNEEAIVIQNAPVLKKGRRATRDILIKLDEVDPLAYELVEYVEECKTDYMLPGLSRGFSRAVESWRHVCRSTVNKRIGELCPELWPHALRGYRASMLVYERGFSVQDLVSWFDWKGADTALHYTRTRDMATAMGIKEVPR